MFCEMSARVCESSSLGYVAPLKPNQTLFCNYYWSVELQYSEYFY